MPAVGGTTPARTRIVVDLPAPLRPSSAVACPAYACEVDAGHGLDLAEAHVEAADVDDGWTAAHAQILPVRAPTRRGIANFAHLGRQL